jgi:hypothetical protein
MLLSFISLFVVQLFSTIFKYLVWVFLFYFFNLLEGVILWHTQKFLQYIKHTILEFIPSIILLSTSNGLYILLFNEQQLCL